MSDQKPSEDQPVVENADQTSTTAIAEATDTKPVATPRKKKVRRSVPAGQVHVQASFNNTIITFTDTSGGVLAWSSAGSNGFRGSKKGTAYAAQVAAEHAGQAAKQQYGFSKRSEERRVGKECR